MAKDHLNELRLADDGGKLTREGQVLANELYWSYCDRLKCVVCPSRSKEGGPGGEYCPAEGVAITQDDVYKLIHLYMGLPPVDVLKQLHRSRPK